MRTNDHGNPVAPWRKVTESKDMGWNSVHDKRGATGGWAVMFLCTLECGHQQSFITEARPTREGDPMPPVQLHCEKCYREQVPSDRC